MQKKDASSTAVAKVAEAMRKEALQCAEGDLLGSEDSLVARYQVSRPTLRQAAGVLAQEQLLMVRRGVGGGYFARRPEAKAVSSIAALYLKAHNAPISEVVATFAPIRVELARLAASCQDEELRDELRKLFAETQTSASAEPNFVDFLLRERRFYELLGKMSGNKTLQLFLSILLDVAARTSRSDDLYRHRPERMAMLNGELNHLGAAVLANDEELALLYANRCAKMSSGWLKEDLNRRSEPPGKRETT
ncbi:FadR/GntR family transcriptional regulator [Pseudomonas sp. NFX224]|uniref:FadR/GntR family transcriptional regulator n=1 Tax=Pseudomonas sp. NFX224 TaxID=3402862 RepID=UPI003AFB7A4A